MQGREERELLDLRQLTGSLQAEVEVFGQASYDNSIGFYMVENEQGTVIDPLTGQSLSPNDPGYARAAIQGRIDLSINNDTDSLTAQIQAGSILAPYLISNSTPEEFLELNPNNEAGQQPLAYFAYLGANPDEVDHVRLLGDNSWGFEDVFGGGDRDYNDLVIKMSLIA
ncbi:MAG: DUF4114 domain-containing protein [Hydrococcus sp. RM1_1_31]|nr:DUF4114 domain-containing protein [Hydrococcus sp. RM1_1_31]